MADIKNPFEGLSKRQVQLGKMKDPQGNPLIVIPHVRDVEAFFLLKKDMDKEDTKKMTEVYVNLLKRTYSGVINEDLEQYVALNYGDMMTEFSILYNLTTREEVEEEKKRRKEAMIKKLESR